MRIVIMGGAGFVGSHLCDRLVADRFEVVCVDSLLTGKAENVRHLLDHPGFTFVKGDITEPIEIPGPVDYVLNFASPASPMDYARHPIHTLKVGALGTYHALGLSQAKGAVFVLASTSEIYGDPEVSPQPESYWGHVNPIGPRSVYDEAKRFAEAISAAYHRQNGVDIRIARIFNTYGPRMRADDGRVVPAFINQALRGEPLTVFGDGSQTRSFCYVSDLVEGILALLNSSVTEPVNIGNPREISVLEFAKMIIAMTQSSSAIEYHDLPVDDPKVRVPDISRAKSLLHWEPQVDLDEGLRRTIQWFSDW